MGSIILGFYRKRLVLLNSDADVLNAGTNARKATKTNSIKRTDSMLLQTELNDDT